MKSQRRAAQFGLISAGLVLLLSLGVIVMQGSGSSDDSNAQNGKATALPISFSLSAAAHPQAGQK